jgi:hypothetical protein
MLEPTLPGGPTLEQAAARVIQAWSDAGIHIVDDRIATILVISVDNVTEAVEALDAATKAPGAQPGMGATQVPTSATDSTRDLVAARCTRPPREDDDQLIPGFRVTRGELDRACQLLMSEGWSGVLPFDQAVASLIEPEGDGR